MLWDWLLCKWGICASSEKIKQNIKEIPQTEIFKSLSLKQYDKVIDDQVINENEIGFLAEEVEKLDDNNEFNLVKEKDGIKHLNYNSIFMLCCNEVQKHKKVIDKLLERIAKLESKK